MQTLDDCSSKLMKINDLARRYDVSLRTLRFYEQRGLLCPRRERTARLYSVRDETRLRLILKGKRLGFSLKEISDLMSETETADAPAHELGLTREATSQQIVRLERRRREVDQAIDELRLALA